MRFHETEKNNEKGTNDVRLKSESLRTIPNSTSRLKARVFYIPELR